jgi:CBS domain-containing protein
MVLTIEPVAYLRALPPFDGVPAPAFEAAAAALEVAFLPAGTRLATAGGAPLAHLYVIRRGTVRLERDGQTVQVLEEGEAFGYTSLLTREASFDVLVEDDVLAYRLPAERFRALLADARFAAHFAAGLGERLRASLDHGRVATFRRDLSSPVSGLVRRPPVWIDLARTVGDAAEVMRDEGISSLLVRAEPPGIVTDRDLRNRVLAADLGPGTPLAEVLSRPLRTVAADTPIHDAWTALLDAGVHHLPVERDGRIVGVVTSTDLLRCTAEGPLAVLRTVERLATRAALPGYADRVAEMASQLLDAGLDAISIAGLVARLGDAVLRRLLSWAEADLGPAPAPYAWLALGSEGRMEQTLLTDQDNALVYADAGAGRRDYWQALADRVGDDLEAAGYPRCPGGYMARRWHGPLSDWTHRFHGWIDAPSPQALLDAAIFLDFRRVGGEAPVEALEAELREAPRRPVFLRFLARSALEFRPPPPLLLRLRGAQAIDLKLHAISPVVFLARCYGLEAGTSSRSTPERLDAARRAGLLDEEVAGLVTEAHRFLLGLRLKLQLRALSEGRAAVDRVVPGDLDAIERARLKDALRAVRRLQESAAFHYRTDF